MRCYLEARAKLVGYDCKDRLILAVAPDSAAVVMEVVAEPLQDAVFRFLVSDARGGLHVQDGLAANDGGRIAANVWLIHPFDEIGLASDTSATQLAISERRVQHQRHAMHPCAAGSLHQAVRVSQYVSALQLLTCLGICKISNI